MCIISNKTYLFMLKKNYPKNKFKTLKIGKLSEARGFATEMWGWVFWKGNIILNMHYAIHMQGFLIHCLLKVKLMFFYLFVWVSGFEMNFPQVPRLKSDLIISGSNIVCLSCFVLSCLCFTLVALVVARFISLWYKYIIFQLSPSNVTLSSKRTYDNGSFGNSQSEYDTGSYVSDYTLMSFESAVWKNCRETRDPLKVATENMTAQGKIVHSLFWHNFSETPYIGVCVSVCEREREHYSVNQNVIFYFFIFKI